MSLKWKDSVWVLVLDLVVKTSQEFWNLCCKYLKQRKRITYLTESRKLDPCRWENTTQLKQCLPADFEGRVCLTSEIPKVAMGWGNDSVDKGSKFKSPGPMWKSWACDFNSSPMGNWRQENHWGLQESQLNKPTTKRQGPGSDSERLDWGWVDGGDTGQRELRFS